MTGTFHKVITEDAIAGLNARGEQSDHFKCSVKTWWSPEASLLYTCIMGCFGHVESFSITQKLQIYYCTHVHRCYRTSRTAAEELQWRGFILMARETEGNTRGMTLHLSLPDFQPILNSKKINKKTRRLSYSKINLWHLEVKV